jgi:hypothetical protein
MTLRAVPPLDPNWFYSTLAQSTAAIVGLGGGFLVQRILHQRSEIATPRSDLLENTRRHWEVVAQARLRARQVAVSLTEVLEEGQAREAAGFGSFRPTKNIYVYEHGRGVQGRANGLPLELDFGVLTKLADSAAAAAEFRAALPATFDDLVSQLEKGGSLEVGDASWLEAPFEAQPGWGEPFVDLMVSQRLNFQSLWRDLKNETAPYGVALRDFKARLVPASFFRLLAVIVGLLLFGTIAPMLYLSARDEGSRALLLVPFAFLSIAFFGFIAAELGRLRAAGDLRKNTF